MTTTATRTIPKASCTAYIVAACGAAYAAGPSRRRGRPSFRSSGDSVLVTSLAIVGGIVAVVLRAVGLTSARGLCIERRSGTLAASRVLTD